MFFICPAALDRLTPTAFPLDDATRFTVLDVPPAAVLQQIMLPFAERFS
eukprot:SAG11_NODE_5633_length_1501_cov_1.574893_3_plen_48_part_01